MSVVYNKRRKAKRKAAKEAKNEPIEEMIGHHGIGFEAFEADALRQKELHEMPEKDIPT